MPNKRKQTTSTNRRKDSALSKLARQNRVPRVQGFPSFGRADPFPPQLRRRLTYCQEHTLTSSATTGVTGTNIGYSMNGLYDPDIVSTGHQPLGFDQYCTSSGPYARYKVHKCFVILEFTNPQIASGDTHTFAVCALRNATNYGSTISGTSFSALKEAQMSRTVYVPSSGSQKAILGFEVPIAGALNLTNQEYEVDMNNSTGSHAANPGWPCYLYIAVAEMVQSAASTVGCNVTINYDVTFYDRITPAQS